MLTKDDFEELEKAYPTDTQIFVECSKKRLAEPTVCLDGCGAQSATELETKVGWCQLTSDEYTIAMLHNTWVLGTIRLGNGCNGNGQMGRQIGSFSGLARKRTAH
eukprot:170794-Prorocentrum_minimum.AAC.3